MLEVLDFSPGKVPSSGSATDLESRVAKLESQAPSNTLCIVVHGGDFESLCAAFVMANSAAGMGVEVKLFFAFWATAALRDPAKVRANKSWVERLFGWMMPSGAADVPLSRMNMGGLGPKMMRKRMEQRGVDDIQAMIKTASELGVQINVCDMSMDLLGMRLEELVDFPGMRLCGAATFVADAMSARTTLFI